MSKKINETLILLEGGITNPYKQRKNQKNGGGSYLITTPLRKGDRLNKINLFSKEVQL